jgi:hypothetical protein
LKKIKTLSEDFCRPAMQGGFFCAIPDISCIGIGHFPLRVDCLIYCKTVSYV